MSLTEIIYFGFELDLLEAHLSQHNPFIDRLVVVECAKTPGGLDKPLLFKENKERFESYNVDYMFLPPEIYPNITKDNVEFIRQERPAKEFVNSKFYGKTDWIWHNDTDEILNIETLASLEDRLRAMPKETQSIHYHLDQRSPLVNAKYGIFHVHRLFRSLEKIPSPKHVKRSALLPEGELAGWHFTNCFSSAEELFWKAKCRNWIVGDWSLEDCREAFAWGAYRLKYHSGFKELAALVPNPDEIKPTTLMDLPFFILDNLQKYPWMRI